MALIWSSTQNLVWMVAEIIVAVIFLAVSPLLMNIAKCYRAILNDASVISRDPALHSWVEVLYAYPGFWALFWYRLCHALRQRQIPLLSTIWPRLVMSVVRCVTSIDIHPEAQLSSEGILIDHGVGLVVGATAIVGSQVTLYHGVTLGGTGKRVPAGSKRHPTIGNRVVIGAGAKILGDILIGDDVLVGANSVVTKPVPANHTAVGIPARVLCHGSSTGKDVTGVAICELHQRLLKVEKESPGSAQPDSIEPSLTTLNTNASSPTGLNLSTESTATPTEQPSPISDQEVSACDEQRYGNEQSKELPVDRMSTEYRIRQSTQRSADKLSQQSSEKISIPPNTELGNTFAGELSAERSEGRLPTARGKDASAHLRWTTERLAPQTGGTLSLLGDDLGWGYPTGGGELDRKSFSSAGKQNVRHPGDQYQKWQTSGVGEILYGLQAVDEATLSGNG